MRAWRFLAALFSLFSQPTTIESTTWSGTSIARKGLGTSDEWVRLHIHGAHMLLIPRYVSSWVLQFSKSPQDLYVTRVGISADAFWDSRTCEIGVQQ